MTSAPMVSDGGVSDAGAELPRIVQINEEIKAIVGVSLKINIMALNAIFLTKRAGMTALTAWIHARISELSTALQGLRHLRRAAGSRAIFP